jgi:hypothetical protein
MQRQGAAIGHEYLASGGGPFPERLHVNALIFDLLWRYTEALGEWAEWAAAEVTHWDGVGDQPDRRAALLERYRDITAQIDQRQNQLPSSRAHTVAPRPPGQGVLPSGRV